MTEQFDVIVVGGGPAGYIGAIRAAQLGFKVACVEKRETLGGTCLNVGCIPSKALLESSKLFNEVKVHGAAHGVKVGKLEVDLHAMMAQKNTAVQGLTQGIEGLFKKNKITWIKGHGEVVDAHAVKVGKDVYRTKNILIATGSDVATLPGLEIDEKKIVSSTGALTLDKVPNHLVVVGAGVIGLELGSVWKRLGAKVTVVEFLDRIIPGADGEVAKQFQKILEKQGFEFKLGTKVTKADAKGKGGVKLSLEPAAGGKAETLEADVVLVAVGRKPYTDKLGLDKVGVELDNRGRIPIDGHFRTKVPSIYAVGDVVVGPMLAHKAEEEAVVAVEIMAGQSGHVDHNLVPGVIYTWPEVANVGKTEEQLKEEGVEYKAGKFPFLANSRARAIGQSEGFVKVLADAKTDRVLGAHIIGPDAGTLIAEVVSVMEFGGAAEDIARTCHAHPTLNEAVKEAALAVDKRTLNM